MRRWAPLAAAALLTTVVAAQPQAPAGAPPLDLFFSAANTDEGTSRAALDKLSQQWRDGYAAMIVDLARLMRPAPRRVESNDFMTSPDVDDPTSFGSERRGGGFEVPAPVRRESLVRGRLTRFLERQTGQPYGDDLGRWREWMWQRPYDPHPDYAAYKGFVYSQIDPVMRRFFPPGTRSLIRLDEIDWGGVKVNGIPPLYHPTVIAAADADYLRDNHLVFGVAVNGEARAYPKRILAWHEMALDRIGGVEMTIVYCTLCGTVIPYESTAGGRLHRFGTSGLLYRSNKLMFDEGTMSLWSTLEGKPVVGPLVDSGIVLTPHAAVTTTWGEWRRQHPDTTVLSLETGHVRDYSEGAAYREYFSTDNLYFAVSNVDRRLKNKEEVLTFTVPGTDGTRGQAVAITAKFLERRPLYEFTSPGVRHLIVTSREGANRVYDAGGTGTRFTGKPTADSVIDADGRTWQITEEALVRQDQPDVRLPRVAAHRAFWFGWYAQFPDTVLIK